MASARTPEEALAALEAALSGVDLDDLERGRLLRDIDRVRRRVEGRQYRLTGFDDNVLNLPDRAQAFFTELDFHASIGRSWAALLAGTGADRAASIADLGPGWVPKVELGLFYRGYRGNVVAIDKDPATAAFISRFLALLLPSFTLEPHVVDVFSAPLPAHPVVTANHVIDDLIVDWFIREWRIAPADLYQQEGVLAEVWRRILARRAASLEEIVPRIAAIFDALTAEGGLLLVSQYPSYVERVLGLPEVSAMNEEALAKVRAILASRGFLEDPSEPARLLAGSGGYLTPESCHVLRRDHRP